MTSTAFPPRSTLAGGKDERHNGIEEKMPYHRLRGLPYRSNKYRREGFIEIEVGRIGKVQSGAATMASVATDREPVTGLCWRPRVRVE
jgi:hypothetical protein